MRFLTIGLFLLGLAHPVFAQGGLAFLTIGTDAEALAMGGAHVAQSSGAYATYWNPAGLAAPSAQHLALSHHVWVADTRTTALAAQFRAGAFGGFGISITATSNNGFEARDRPGDPAGLFDVQYLNAGVSFGQQIGPLNIGVTAKYLTERIFTASANGYAFDFGAQVALFDESIRLGIAAQHLGKMGKLNAVATPLPRTFRAGFAFYPLRIFTTLDGTSVLNTFLSVEVARQSLENGERTQIHLGASAEVLETVVLRAGYISNDALRKFSFGAGFNWTSFQFDYAMLPFQTGFSGAGHILTLQYQW